MKLHELLEDEWDDTNNFDRDHRDTIPNPLPLADYATMGKVLDKADALTDAVVAKYRNEGHQDTAYPILFQQARVEVGNIESVPISAIIATEKYLDREHINALVNGTAARKPSGDITLIKTGGKYYVQDGNHRITAAALKKAGEIEANVIDVGNN